MIQVELTLAGVIILPLALFVFFRDSKYILGVLFFVSIFHGASVLNFTYGGMKLAISPYYFIGSLISLRFILSVLFKGSRVYKVLSRTSTVLLLLFWFWSIITALILPHIFSGLEVYAPRVGFAALSQQREYLKFSFSNIGQAIYLTINIFVILFAVVEINRFNQFSYLLKSFQLAALTSITLSFYQRLVYMVDSWKYLYPHALLYSNPIYYIGAEQKMGGIYRINATFAEPSVAAAFYSSIFSGSLAAFVHAGQLFWLIEALVATLAIINTLSTTGIVVWFATVLMLTLSITTISIFSKVKFVQIARLSVLMLAFIGLSSLLPILITKYPAIYEITINKMHSLSYSRRISADLYSMILILETYGLGVGLGSNRPSSLLASMLTNVGILGTMLFALYLYSTIRPILRSNFAEAKFIVWTLVALLVAQAVSLPNLNFPPLWVLLTLSSVYQRLLSDRQVVNKYEIRGEMNE